MGGLNPTVWVRSDETLKKHGKWSERRILPDDQPYLSCQEVERMAKESAVCLVLQSIENLDNDTQQKVINAMQPYLAKVGAKFYFQWAVKTIARRVAILTMQKTLLQLTEKDQNYNQYTEKQKSFVLQSLSREIPISIEQALKDHHAPEINNIKELYATQTS
jgi:hypothetical protein